MKYTLFLLAAMVGAVCGVELGAEIKGVVTIGEPCSVADQDVLYKECVEDVAVSMGVDLSRRLELRGNRELAGCPGFCHGHPSATHRGTYCFTHCSSGTGRRLTMSDEQAHTERFLIQKGVIQQEANDCLDRKIEEGYACLGNPEDLKIKIYLA